MLMSIRKTVLLLLVLDQPVPLPHKRILNSNYYSCNPNTKLCPNAICSPVQTSGRLIVQSPNTGTFYSIGQLINVTWTYSSQSNPNFPSNSVNLYYRPANRNDWINWATLSPNTTTWQGNIDNAADGSYEVLILPDNIDSSGGVFKVGNKVSCIADGWPYTVSQKFRLIASQNILPTSFKPNADVTPNTNSEADLEISWLRDFSLVVWFLLM